MRFSPRHTARWLLAAACVSIGTWPLLASDGWAKGPNNSQPTLSADKQRRGDVRVEGPTNAPSENAASLVSFAVLPKEEGSWTHQPDWWVAIFTAALFFVTAVLSFFTYKLWNITVKAVADASENTKIANDALQHAREASVRELRAYLTVETASFERAMSGFAPKFTIVLKNTGKTPALSASVLLSVRLVDMPVIELEPPFRNGHISRSDIGSDLVTTIDITLGRPLNDVDMHRIGAGDQIICVWGVADYCDISGAKRTTSFRFILNSQSLLTGSLMNSDTGNSVL